ncbi:MAG: hypothetical protein MUE82_06585 [Chloroflexi bacterium]|nr:hypothetical protein [Chloroflexota bacterium]
MSEAKKPAQGGKTTSGTWTAEEKAAMRAHAKEQKAAAEKADGEAMAAASIAEMPEPDRSLAERIHAIVKAAAPSLGARTWYGMPAYAKDGKVICFFQAASKFKVRYATFGFQPDAALDDGEMWPTSFAVTELTPEVEARIADLVSKAAG